MVKTEHLEEDARALYQAQLKAERCSFCGRTPLEVISMVAGSKVRICNYCVDSFHEMIHPKRGSGLAGE